MRFSLNGHIGDIENEQSIATGHVLWSSVLTSIMDNHHYYFICSIWWTMNNGWEPVKDNTINPINEKMKNYKQPFNIYGCITYIFIFIVIILFLLGYYYGFNCIIDINCLT